jgi:Uma2 family endonuclease
MSSITHLLTLEEAAKLPVDPLEEIVNGEVRKIPPPEDAHAALIEELHHLLSQQLRREEFRIRSTAYGLGIRTTPSVAVRNPDLTVFRQSDWKAGFKQSPYVWIPPVLVVECLSPSNRKGSIHQLLADYETAGAAEVWLLDPRRRTAEKYVLEQGLYGSPKTMREGELRPNGLSVTVDLDRLWTVFETGG